MTPTRRASTEPETGGAPAVEQALARAAHHARNAAAEGLEAVRALLDAIAILMGSASADSQPALAKAAHWLDRLSGELAAGPHDAALTRALSDALDAEIGRWEERARSDPDARAVLRAFLGLRELLWELGVRPTPAAAEPARPAPQARRARRRVERVPIQG